MAVRGGPGLSYFFGGNTAKIIPLHKNDSKFDHINYRPISLLSVFSKIYEKLIYSRIYSYLDKYNLILGKPSQMREIISNEKNNLK